MLSHRRPNLLPSLCRPRRGRVPKSALPQAFAYSSPGDRFSVVFSPASVGAFGPPSRRLSGSGRGDRLPDARANTDRPCKLRSHRFSSPGCRPQVKAPPGRAGMGLPSGQGGRSFPRAFPAAAGLYRPRREQVAKPAQSPRLPHVPPPATGFPAFFLRLPSRLLPLHPAAFPAAAARRAVSPLRFSAQKSGARQKRGEGGGIRSCPAGQARAPRPLPKKLRQQGGGAAASSPARGRRRGRRALLPTGTDGGRSRAGLRRALRPRSFPPPSSAAPGRGRKRARPPLSGRRGRRARGAQSRPPFSSIVRV